MDIINQKIHKMTGTLNAQKTISRRPLEMEYVSVSCYKKDNTPPAPDADWIKLSETSVFSGVDEHYWLHTKFRTEALPEHHEPRLFIRTGREGIDDAKNPQFTVYVNGKTTQAFDTNHTWMPLSQDTEYDIYIYLYTGMRGGNFFVLPTLETVDLRIEGLYYDIHVPYECMQQLEENSCDYIEIRTKLDNALLKLDLRDIYSDSYYNGIAKASDYLKTNLYNKEYPNTLGTACCIGHTHIDVAWLWTVAQTREKAQRSFSTALNLMNYYDEYMFMSSQPQLYQYVKESDPEMYAEIKERVQEGRWEVEGAMWLEADTNLISGESLIRQILFGKRFMKEEFGVDSKILWLPDVFGYSGALPQILKKSGIDNFFTSKLEWNDTNPMPHDNFIWEGIDGSKVFAILNTGYVMQLNPELICNEWKKFKDKALSDNILVTFGYGDGGGGTTYEMMENYKRLKHGIPGMPEVKIQSVSDTYKDTIAKVHSKANELNVSVPKWKGEMYLEFHRGTYTTMAKNKKNNRKSELLYLEAETASVADMLLTGGEYPTDILNKNQQTILLNQFHDIIPGSSIKPVYDVTDAEYETILGDGRNIVNTKLTSIMKSLNTKGGFFIYNPSPFTVSDFIEFDGKTIFADKIPAHGWRVIPENYVDNSIVVSDKSIENDVLKVIFNDSYHIISIYDKTENREVLASGSEANVLEMFEDYPYDFDAWELSDYYKQKKWIADDVSGVELLKNGLRIKRKYMKSEISQDIILREGSKRIDFVTTVDWHENHTLLKASFPVDIHNTFATYDIQFGNVQRPTYSSTNQDSAKFEVCAHKWSDLSENTYGVSLLNDCKYGYSTEENVMKITLLKSAKWPNPEADMGINTFTYSLYPHTGDCRVGKTVAEGYLLNMPLEVYRVDANNGTIPDCYSLIENNNENVVIETVKKAESDNSVIVRLYEPHNCKANTTVTANFDFKEVYLCDLMENNITQLENNGRSINLNLTNFEIVTLKFVR